MSSQDPQPPPNANVPWYEPTLHDDRIPPATYSLLEHYSHIPRPAIPAHIARIRNKAWSIFPYPCIGQWRFLDLSIAQHPAYARVLSLLKEGAPADTTATDVDNNCKDHHHQQSQQSQQKTLLDLGCCFAQDIRKLIHDGAPATSLHACDLNPAFLELGYDLFADRDSCRAHFFTADLLSSDGDDSSGLAALAGSLDVVYAASFFHLFSWEEQVRVAVRVIGVLRPRGGSLVFGRQTGNVRGRETRSAVRRGMLSTTAAEEEGGGEQGERKIWRHDVASFSRLWEVAGGLTGSRWEVWAELYEGPGLSREWAEEGIRMLRFEVVRL